MTLRSLADNKRPGLEGMTDHEMAAMLTMARNLLGEVQASRRLDGDKRDRFICHLNTPGFVGRVYRLIYETMKNTGETFRF